MGAVSGVIVLLLCLVAIFADVLAPFHYMEMTMLDRLKGPSSTYPLGTDHIGRDVFSRLLYGARVSLAVGFAATTLSVVVSLLIGGVAGFVGGKLDLAVQRVVDAWMSFLLNHDRLGDHRGPISPSAQERSSGERRAVDRDAPHGCPEQVTEVGAVTGNESTAAEVDCRAQHRRILVVDWQAFHSLNAATEREDPDRIGQCIESGKRRWVSCDQVSP